MTASRITACLAVSAALHMGCAEPTSEGDLELGSDELEHTAEVVQALASDPSTVATHGYCWHNHIYNGTRARIYYPSNGGCSKSVYSPLVVIVHARGAMPLGGNYNHTRYHYLQRHLARNGFISVSVEVGMQDADDAAVTAWDFVEDYVWSVWPKSVYIDPSSVALVGHSRGGAAMRYLAQSLENHPIFTVKSVVNLAPASQGPDLDGNQTEGYFHIYGTSDGDTSPGATFANHDRAGDDGSQLDPIWNDDVVYKSVKLLEGATHGGYIDGGPQNDAVKGYVLAYLAAHNKGDATWYEDYIRGDAVPGGWAQPIHTTYSDGFYRRVIDHFDDGIVNNSTIGGTVGYANATAQVFDPGFPHDTDVMWMWGHNTSGVVVWTIPAGKRNAGGFEWLSLRIAQLSGAPANDLRIQIRDGITWSKEIRLTDHGTIPQPTEMCFGQQGLGCLPADLDVVNHMATIRVPLSAFGTHDDVQYVRLRFRGDSAVDTFMIDNLEFSEFILKP